MSRTVTKGIDYTDKDYESFRAKMIAKLQEKMPEYTDTRQTDAGIVILELNAMGLDIISFHQDIVANEVFLGTAEQRSSADKWCKMLGYTPRSATPARFKQVFVLSSVQATDTTIPKGTIVKTEGNSIEPEVKFETETDLVIPAGKLGNEQDESLNYLYTVNVVQGTTISNELLGTSNATADQSFTLSYSPVMSEGLEVRVNEGEGFVIWTKVDNFMDSAKDSRHYTLNIAENNTATVTFGNGVFGKIPVARANSIYATYRIGGGESGNVGADKINKLGSNLALVNETFNPALPIEYGVDKETLEEIKVNAPVYSRTMWGALTLQDFPALIKIHFPTVIQASSKRDTENVDNIYVYLLLQDNATLTEELEAEILDFFDENSGGRKIVGIGEILLTQATVTPVNFAITLKVEDRYSRATVESAVTAYLTDYFAIGNYPFGQDLVLSRLITNIMDTDNQIAGLKSLVITAPATDINTPSSGEIYSLGTITYTTTGGVA